MCIALPAMGQGKKDKKKGTPKTEQAAPGTTDAKSGANVKNHNSWRHSPLYTVSST